jgi:hypothetical protein
MDYRETMLFRQCKTEERYRAMLAQLEQSRRESAADTRRTMHAYDCHDQPAALSQGGDLLAELRRIGSMLEKLLYLSSLPDLSFFESPAFIELFTTFLLKHEDRLRPYIQLLAAREKKTRTKKAPAEAGPLAPIP